MSIPSTTSRKPPIILCVDDYKNILDTLREQLTMHLGDRFRIEIAESGEEGLELLQEFREDGRDVAVIVSDFLMPGGMPGDEFLIQAHALFPDTRKIMLTGEAELTNVANAVNRAKLYRYIKKPWDAQDLKLTVEEAANSYLLGLSLEEKNRILKLLHEAALIITNQVELDELLRELMNRVLEFSDAEGGLLVLLSEGELTVAAQARRGSAVQIIENSPLAGFSEPVPAAFIEEVSRRNEAIALGHASTEGSDPYFAGQGVKAALGLPIRNMGKLVGILYLEHRTTPALFTPERIEILDILASDAGVAIENARLYQHMESLVNERTQDLSEAYRQKLAVDSHKDKMIHIVSHDIRSPLSGIASLATLLQDREIAGQTDQVIKYGGIIQNSINTVVKFVEDILDLAKLESGTIVLQKETLDLGPYLSNLLKTWEAFALTKQVSLSLEGGNGVQVEADGARLAQAFNNILSNSIKFTPKGGQVSLSAAAETHNGQPVAAIRIRDTGVGIPAEELPKLFEKFNKFQRSGTKGEKGTGLGMSIAKEVIDLHGGSIEVESEVGVGTTFTIRLPA